MTLTNLIPFRKQRRHGSLSPVRRTSDYPFLRLQEEMNRLFDDYLPGFSRGEKDLMRFPGGNWDFTPEVDIRKRRKRSWSQPSYPALTRKTSRSASTATFSPSAVRSARRDRERGHVDRSECSYGSFLRSIPIGARLILTRSRRRSRKECSG